eukprot:PITA_05820
MQKTREQLLAPGVIGGVVDDFDPLYKLSVLCGYTETSLGEQVSPDDMLFEPLIFFDEDYNAVPDPESFINPNNQVMTDSETPGHEYLHWLNTQRFSSNTHVVLPSDSLVTYEAPRPRHSSKMVFTLFKDPCHPLIKPNSRESFSTRAFANENRLRPPMSAGYFYIKIENENEEGNKSTSTKCSTSYSTSKRSKNKKR